MKRTVYTIQIGQCGLQIGHEFWKQMCSRLSINPDRSQKTKPLNNISERKELFFDETSSGKVIPRAILFDLEPRILNKLQNSTLSDFYFKENIITDKHSAGNNWVNGYNKAIEYKDILVNIFRKNIEKCDNTPSFNIFHSLVGGTGSGSCSYILETIKEEFWGNFINSYTVIPNQKENSDSVVQPYNSILSLNWLTLYCDCVVFFENYSVEKIINSQNGTYKTQLSQINALIANIITTLNISAFSSNLFNYNLEGIFVPIIPTPNLHFFNSGISNYNLRGKKTNNNSLPENDFLKKMINNRSTSNSFENGKLISSYHILNRNLEEFYFFKKLKRVYEDSQIKFIDWTPPSIHYSNNFHYSGDYKFKETEVCFYNHTSVRNIFKNTLKQYDILRKRNAFLNNYLREFTEQNGLETFDNVRETIFSLISEYESADTTFFP